MKKSEEDFFSGNKKWIALAFIIGATFAAFLPSLQNEFTNWDDPVYVMENELIRELSSDNLKTIFNPKTEVSLNYHPLTILSLALNYKVSELKPGSYFFTNIILHLLNTALVFFFVFLLLGKKPEPALLVALLFGIHPLHVESVSWISERKDVLYTFFYLGGLIAYLKYLEKSKVAFIALAFFLFILSCLSKAVGVTLPIAFFLIDFLKERKISSKMIFEKIPFLAVSLLLGYNTMTIQSEGGAVNEFSTFTILQRIMFASYGFFMYLVKLFAPVKLSAFYPYPHLITEGGPLPMIFNIAPLIALAAVAVPLALAWFFWKSHFKLVAFGIAFYFLTVALVLQFISVGSVIMADRYSYVPYIGIFIILAMLAESIKSHFWKHGAKIVYAVIIAYGIFFWYTTYERTKVWHSTETLWTDVIEKYPGRVEVAYMNRGKDYALQNKMDKAWADYQILEKMNSKDHKVYNNLGNVYSILEKFDKAIAAYSRSLELEKDNFDAYINRGVTHAKMGNFPQALEDFDKAYSMDPKSDKLYENRAYVYLQSKDYAKSIADYNYLLKKYPSNFNHIHNRGINQFYLGNYKDAINDFALTIRINPNYLDAYMNLSRTYYLNGQHAEALAMAYKAKQKGYKVEDSYIQQLQNLSKQANP